MPKRSVHTDHARCLTMRTASRDGTLVSTRSCDTLVARGAAGDRHRRVCAARPIRLDELVAAIDAACTEIGFFVVTGHGIESQVDEVFDAARALFALPEATKEALAMVDRQGFVPAHQHSARSTASTALRRSTTTSAPAATGAGRRRPTCPPSGTSSRATSRRCSASPPICCGRWRSALDLPPSFFADRMHDPAVLPADVPLRAAPMRRTTSRRCSPTRTPTTD